MDRTETPENAPGPTSDEARVADSPPGTASGESASPESSSSITSTTGSASANHDDADPRISGESHQSMLARTLMDLARGEETASALERNLSKLERNLDALLASLEPKAEHSGPNSDVPQQKKDAR